jgi:hypothetical protein
VSWEGQFAYSYVENGKLVERLEAAENNLDTFESRVRNRSEVPGKEPTAIASDFVKARDAYVPDIYGTYFFGDGRTAPRIQLGTAQKVGNPGFVMVVTGKEVTSVPEFERIDYVVLKNAPRCSALP